MVSYPNHTVPGHVYQYQVLILLPVNDNLLFLNQQKRDFFYHEECARHEG